MGPNTKIEIQVNRMAVLESSLMLSVVSAFADGRRQTEMINYLRLLRLANTALSAGEGKRRRR